MVVPDLPKGKEGGENDTKGPAGSCHCCPLLRRTSSHDAASTIRLDECVFKVGFQVSSHYKEILTDVI